MGCEVIILEDDVVLASKLLELIKERLDLSGIYVSSVHMALFHCKRHSPLVFIQDLFLPGENSLHFTRTFQKYVKVHFVITGKPIQIRNNSIFQGVHRVIFKPFNLDQFIDELVSHLHGFKKVSEDKPPLDLIKDRFKEYNLKMTTYDHYILKNLLRFRKIPKSNFKEYFGVTDGNLRVILYRLNRKFQRAKLSLSVRLDYKGSLRLLGSIDKKVE